MFKKTTVFRLKILLILYCFCQRYVAPKHVPALCPDDDSTRADLEAEAGAKAKKAKLSKAIVEDLKRQYLDTPEEEFNHADHMRAKQLADMRERIR